MPSKIFSFLLLFVLSGCVSGYDPGGFVDDYLKKAAEMDRAGVMTPLPEQCDSACHLLLSSSMACVRPNGSFGIHEVRTTRNRKTPYSEGVRNDEITKKNQSLIPRCARDLFNKYGAYDGPIAKIFQVKDILAACGGPQGTIKQCPQHLL